MIKLFVALLLGFFFPSQAKEKKYNFAICALFKNEEKNLREWIEYHRMIGVDHFYLYDNGSQDQSRKVLKPFIEEKVVTLVKWPDLIQKEESLASWSLSTQVPAYENAIVRYGKKEAKWFAILDVDEFLLPVTQDSIVTVLNTFHNEAGIAISTECFDASYEQGTSVKKFVIETDDVTKEPDMDVRETVRKVIFKPESYAGSQWAPYACQLKEGKSPKEVSEQVIRINRYVGRNKNSEKKKRYLPKGAEKRPLLDAGFTIDDQRRSIHRFLPELSKRL